MLTQTEFQTMITEKVNAIAADTAATKTAVEALLSGATVPDTAVEAVNIGFSTIASGLTEIKNLVIPPVPVE